MRTSIIDFETRCAQRYYRLLKHVRAHCLDDGADPNGELGTLLKVHAAVREGALSYRDAHAALSALRADQQATEAAA